VTSRDEMREAKKAAGLCLHDGCGNKAELAPLSNYCEKHRSEDPHFRRLAGRRRRSQSK
jgi:hypothetical protein